MFQMYTCTVLLLRFVCVAWMFCEGGIVWRNDIKIRSADIATDMEQISSVILSSLNLAVEDNKLERLHYLSDHQVAVRAEYQQVPVQEYDYPIDYDQADMSKNQSRKRLAEDYDTTNKVFINGSVEEVDYDLDQFKKEYDSVTLQEPDIQTVANRDNTSFIESNDDRPFQVNKVEEKTHKCMELSHWRYLYKGIPCTWHEIKNLNKSGKVLRILILLLRTMTVWSIVWAVVAVCMWCYAGWCCCCLPFDLLHPYEGIKTIKNSAIQNPPGIQKLEDGTTIEYQPSEREIKAYKDLMKSIFS